VCALVQSQSLREVAPGAVDQPKVREIDRGRRVIGPELAVRDLEGTHVERLGLVICATLHEERPEVVERKGEVRVIADCLLVRGDRSLEHSLGLGPIPEKAVNLAQVAQRLCDEGMIGSVCRLADLHGATVASRGSLVVSSHVGDQGEVVDHLRHVWMLGPECGFERLSRTGQDPLCLVVLAASMVQQAEIVERGCHRGLLGAEQLDPELDRATVQWLCLVV
jgi:hypothetical protein